MLFLQHYKLDYTFFAIRLASLFNPKAAKMISGRKNVFQELENSINSNYNYIWFHCASLGEFEQGRPLIEMIKEKAGEKSKTKIILSFFSPSGYEIRKNYQHADIVCYLPFDTPSNAKNFIDIVNPICSVFVKYEIWYHYLNELNRRTTPTYLISGVFRPNQVFFKHFGSFLSQSTKLFSHACFLQDTQSQVLLSEFGLENTDVCGDTRIDRVISIAAERYDNLLLDEFCKGNQILVFGSTWPADEEILCAYINTAPAGLRFIIAPHETHESHINLIENRLAVKSSRMSTLEKVENDLKVIIVDSIGLLSKLYRYGKIAYVGGGFGKGIHNINEAAVYSIPIIFGPEHKNSAKPSI
jgi:3-deoxy-D-manno-octulosonic-acid transferase